MRVQGLLLVQGLRPAWNGVGAGAAARHLVLQASALVLAPPATHAPPALSPHRYVWHNGNQYDGEWRAGRMHGQGTLKWVTGECGALVVCIVSGWLSACQRSLLPG